MEAVLTRPEKDIVEAYWKMLSTLSRTVKLSLARSILENAFYIEQDCKIESCIKTDEICA